MVDLINLQEYRLHHIVTNKLKTRFPKMVHHILLPPCKEVIDHNYIITPIDELINEVTPHETSSTSHHYPQPPLPERHRNPPPDLAQAMSTEIGYARDLITEGSSYGGIGVGRPNSRESRLEDEECGAN